MKHRDKPKNFEMRREIRTTQDVERKAEILMKTYPELYESISHVYRAGVNALYRIKILNKLQDWGEIKNDNQT